MNNERDIAMNTQPYAEDLGVAHTDHVAPGNIVDKVPLQFVCFSDHWRLPRKYCKAESGSYDVFVWSEGRWQFHDNVDADTANEWYRNESETYVPPTSAFTQPVKEKHEQPRVSRNNQPTR